MSMSNMALAAIERDYAPMFRSIGLYDEFPTKYPESVKKLGKIISHTTYPTVATQLLTMSEVLENLYGDRFRYDYKYLSEVSVMLYGTRDSIYNNSLDHIERACRDRIHQ
jgi:hypothetical protein